MLSKGSHLRRLSDQTLSLMENDTTAGELTEPSLKDGQYGGSVMMSDY